MHQSYRTAKRLPPLAERNTIPPDALADYDRLMEFVRKYSETNSVARSRPYVDGKPYASDYRTSFTNAPRLAMLLIDLGYGINAYQGQPGWFSPVDHEWIDLVLGFDSGYWAFHAGHTANAVSAGVRIEAMEAVRDGREEQLTDDEREVIAFIRAVRDGRMTDEIWIGMTERLGSVAGTIGLALYVCFLWTVMRMMGALGVATIEQDDWNAMIRAYKEGTKNPADATQDYVWDTNLRPVDASASTT